MSDLACVVWFDAGGTTGWSVFCVLAVALGDPYTRVLDSVEHWAAGEIYGDENRQKDQCCELIAAWEEAAIGLESFTLRKFSQDSDLLLPVRINSVLDWYLHKIGRRSPLLQSPSMAMTTVTDERLKDVDYWVSGQEHARDAIKHTLTFLRRCKDSGGPRLRHQAWPNLFDAKGDLL